MADAHLPALVRNLPLDMVMLGKTLRPEVASYVQQGVVKVIAGPELCHVLVDVKRPYNRPQIYAKVAHAG